MLQLTGVVVELNSHYFEQLLRGAVFALEDISAQWKVAVLPGVHALIIAAAVYATASCKYP
jgi:hypothetical protein